MSRLTRTGIPCLFIADKSVVARFALAVLLLLALTVPSQAQMAIDSGIRPAPHFTTLPDAQFNAQTVAYVEAPPMDKSLAYSIRLPDTWHKTGASHLTDITTETENGVGNISHTEVNHHILGTIARYDAPITDQAISRVEISAVDLDFDISVRNWFVNYVVTNGYTLQGIDEVTPNRVVAVYILVDHAQSYVVRTVAEVNGSRIALASYFMPEEKWNVEKALQEKVVDSFHFIHPEPISVEVTHTYAFLDLLRFDYPISWRLDAPEIGSSSDMSARIIDSRGGGQNSAIDIHVVATDQETTLADQIKGLHEALTERKLQLGNLLDQPKDFHIPKQVYDSHVEVYEARGTEGQYAPQEFWLAVLTENRFYYVISMVTPGRSSDFLDWSRNTEAFRIVVESIRP